MQFDFFKGVSLPNSQQDTEIFRNGFKELKQRVTALHSSRDLASIYNEADKCEMRVIMDTTRSESIRIPREVTSAQMSKGIVLC